MDTQRITAAFPALDQIEALAKNAFPPEEYLSPADLIRMAENGEVDFLALYDGGALVGFMVVSSFRHMCYLFFLAIDPSCRSKGYGGQALRLLDSLYPGKQQVVDFEMIDPAAPNNAQRISRRAFYLRNGYRETGRFLSYLGVDYEILCRDAAFDFDTFQDMMAHFHIDGFHPRYFDKR